MKRKYSQGVKRKHRKSKKQLMWNYMRRNRVFRLGDVMSVVSISRGTLHSILWHLLYIGYVRTKDDLSVAEVDRRYLLVRNTGAQSPSISRYEVYDHTTDEKFEIKRSRDE